MRTLLLAFFLAHTGSASLFDWLGWSEASKEEKTVFSDGVPLLGIPFEELSPEEKFLVEASKITGLKLSQLDTCQHRLVMKLKASCASLSEEDLARLSVNLLNCQSAVEGRQQYPCTENMSLKACTKEMDSETWNAYHLMSNRARAVCYSARQEQFRALSEMTVNKLMTTAHSHISAMATLEGKQARMEEAASAAVKSVVEGQKEAVRGQGALKASQAGLARSVAHTLDCLARERDLARSLRANFTLLVKAVQSKLDEAGNRISEQSKEMEEEHKKIVSELESLSALASEIWVKMDKSSATVLEHHEAVIDRFEATLSKLREINASVEFLASLADSIRQNAGSKLGFVSDFVGVNGERLESALTAGGQSLALAVAMLLCCFLEVSRPAKVLLVVLGPANLYLSLHRDFSHSALPLPTLYAGFVALTGLYFAVDFLFRLGWRYATRMRRRRRRSGGGGPADASGSDPLDRQYGKVSEWLKVRGGNSRREEDDDPLVTSSNGVQRDDVLSRIQTAIQDVRALHAQEDEFEDGISVGSEARRRRRSSVGRQRSSVTSLAGSSGSGAGRSTCTALTKTGQRCRNLAPRGLYCTRHHPADASSLG